MADTKSPGSIAKLFTILAPETVPVSVRKIIYHGAAIDLDGKTVHLSVCYIGPMIYGFYVSGRRERIYQPQKRIDKSDMIPMFARFYGLSDIRLDRIFGSRSRDWLRAVASENVLGFDDLTRWVAFRPNKASNCPIARASFTALDGILSQRRFLVSSVTNTSALVFLFLLRRAERPVGRGRSVWC